MPLNPLRQVLANGVVVLAQENHTTPAVSLLAVMGVGGYDDPVGQEGTAALVARMLDRGTETRSADAIADELDGRGAALSVSAGRHQVAVAAQCLQEDFGSVLAIAADLLRAPAFPDEALTARRAETLTLIRQDDDDPASVAVHRFMADVYGSHPYARRVRGTAGTVSGLERVHLAAFHQAWFAPGALTVVAVGSLGAAELVAHVERALGGWSGADTPRPLRVPDGPAAAGRRVVRIAMPDKAQADVAYGFVGIRRADPRYLAATVMNNALGQYALGGRLGDSIRERQGMAYYVYSSLDAGLGPGPLMVRAGVSAANVERTIASIDAELASVAGEGFTAREVAESTQYLVGSLPRQLETNAGIAGFLLNAELFDLGLDYDRRLPDLLRAVTHDAVMDTARALLIPDHATIVVAGPEP